MSHAVTQSFLNNQAYKLLAYLHLSRKKISGSVGAII